LASGHRPAYRLAIMRIDEIFVSIQGEGSRRGRPCSFVRLTGCPLRCRWCDTAYAFHGGHELRIEEIRQRVKAFGPRLVCVTGGEPLAQPDVHRLMAGLLEDGCEVLLETSGAVDARCVDERVIRILDLKAPGSGEVDRTHAETFAELRPTDEVKIVIADRIDYEWARSQIRDRQLESRVHCVLLSPVHGELDPAELADWILADAMPVVLQLQEHKLLWPGVERGI
jgi:7-carboxy-7-deazaguanine synthase